MHEKAVKKITGTIIGSLKRCKVVDNWPQYESFTAHVDSLAKEVLKHKSEWLSATDVYSIYYDLVYEAINEKSNTEKKFSGLLVDLLYEDGLQQLTNKLINFYVSVPRNYSIYLPLPRVSKNIGHSIQLSETWELACFKNADEVPGGYSRGLMQFSNKLELDKVYLKFNAKGYCNRSLENKALKKSMSDFKILIQQGLFKGLFKIIDSQPAGRGLLSGLTHYQIPKSCIVSVDNTDVADRVISTELPIEISKLLDGIDFNWENDKVENPFSEGNFELPLRGYLRLPSLLIDSDEPEAIRIKAAIEWCFDSLVNENETMSFLQICIGLESLLGDEKSNGSLTDTLADRCAYLISGDIKGRGTIKSQFKDLYKVRSKLVHGVKVSLEHDQKWYKNWGKSVLEFAIIKEIKHLNLK